MIWQNDQVPPDHVIEHLNEPANEHVNGHVLETSKEHV